MEEKNQSIQDSFGRVKRGGDMIGRFYEIFLASHPDIAPRFKNSNMTEQKGLLRQGLNLAIMFGDDNPVGQNGIARIRASHAKDKLDIPPNLYKYWLESLIQTISEFDKEFTPELEKEWRRVMQKAIDFIAAGHGKSEGADQSAA